jgi:biopolymer transport protein ExbD
MSVGGGNSQDADINLAPIIDCFTVLIAFMLVSASFLSIGVLDAGIAAATPAPQNTPPPPVQIEVLIKANHTFEIRLTGKEKRNISVSQIDGLPSELNALKSKYSTVSGATLSAENGVEYKEVIQTMDITRKSFAAVALGGF